ncbi:LysR family transcriptional regulator [Martelella sp. HB161492]|uniref:LysR family transcriptional regulator n=1 Tax=Martelella sp. HB161492 TaxID=2720726 RepID=UPI0015916D5C|nr:LysR family transcriptional regulator [Martelella sp. HB161492]
MESKLLEDVLILLEEGNLSRAAERRHVTQPAFSRRIRAFEDWVGVTLIERHPNQVSMGEALRINEEEIRSVLRRIETLRHKIRNFEHAEKSMVIATQHALCISVFADLNNLLTSHWGPISWRVRTMNRQDCLALFVRGDADLLLCYEARDLPPLPFNERVARAVWRRDTLIPVVGGSWRYRISADGTLPEDIPYVAFPVNSHFGQLVEAFEPAQMIAAGISGPKIESAFSVGVLDMIRSGLGFGWVPHAIARPLVASGALVSLAQRHGRIPLDISVFGWSDDPKGAAVIDLMRGVDTLRQPAKMQF